LLRCQRAAKSLNPFVVVDREHDADRGRIARLFIVVAGTTGPNIQITVALRCAQAPVIDILRVSYDGLSRALEHHCLAGVSAEDDPAAEAGGHGVKHHRQVLVGPRKLCGIGIVVAEQTRRRIENGLAQPLTDLG